MAERAQQAKDYTPDWTFGGMLPWRCPYCERHFDTSSARSHKRTIDHIVPRYYGGTNNPRNLAMVCKDCNQSKSNLTLAEFCRKRGYDLQRVIVRLRKQTGAPGLVGECCS